ncbi:MAG TPA: hypothetical protein VJP78_06185 [Thermoleophilia bacterium]|nr:hypothetical protein [Thermoleophilia bacterium]
MKKPPLDKLVSILVALGVPGLVLLVAVAAAGVTGGAAIVVALATLGGPLGMLGGIALLALLVLISKALAEYGLEALFRRVLKGLKHKGMSKVEILGAIAAYPISRELKGKLRDSVERFFDEGNEKK